MRFHQKIFANCIMHFACNFFKFFSNSRFTGEKKAFLCNKKFSLKIFMQRELANGYCVRVSLKSASKVRMLSDLTRTDLDQLTHLKYIKHPAPRSEQEVSWEPTRVFPYSKKLIIRIIMKAFWIVIRLIMVK